jgi:CHAD domain-containing protein
MATTTEAERKYDVPGDFTLPDLSRIPSVASVDEPKELRLDATYYDTAGLCLTAAHVTLRRRAGGHDAGWTIKRPAGDGDRSETSAPLTDPAAGVPDEVAEQVRDLSGGAPLGPVAHVRTRRLERPLRGPDGTVLALVADDTVATEALGKPVLVQRWREVEVELVDGPRGLFDEVDAALLAAGARPARAESKLARALGDRLPVEPDPLVEYLRAQRDAVRGNEAGVREGDADAVHDMRVATRRLRSTLRTFGPLLDRARTDQLGEELHWLAGLLGGVRDGDVMTDRLTEAVAAEPPEDVIGPVAERIRERLGERTGTAREELIEALDGDRYRLILDDLDHLAAGRMRAEGVPATRRRLFKRTRRALRRADRRLAAADEAQPPDRNALLHGSRRAYKRARYAVETVRPLAGKPAKRLVKGLTTLQDVLGVHQDAIVTGQLLEELGEQATAHGENAFTYGVLRARQEQAAERSLDDLPAARKKAGRGKVRRWLRR